MADYLRGPAAPERRCSVLMLLMLRIGVASRSRLVALSGRLTTLLGHGGTPSPLPLSRAAQPFADHLRASRDPSVGGSRANPPDWRCATWDQARANESWRARPRLTARQRMARRHDADRHQ